MSIRFYIVVLLNCVCISLSAWSTTPHMLVAELAYLHLTEDVRIKANHLIAVHAKEYPKTNDFVSAAVWADELRFDSDDHSYDDWHYINLKFRTRTDPMPQINAFPAPPHVVWAVRHELNILRQPSTPANASEQGLALRRLIHWVGDSHQPLHTITQVSATHRQGDRGGNDFILSAEAPEANLHALWDGGVDEPAWRRHILRPLSKGDRWKLMQMALALESRHPQAVGSLDPAVWVLEGHALARQYAYQGIEPGGLPSLAYTSRGQMLSEQRIVLAGLRLAALLNESLRHQPYDIINKGNKPIREL